MEAGRGGGYREKAVEEKEDIVAKKGREWRPTRKSGGCVFWGFSTPCMSMLYTGEKYTAKKLSQSFFCPRERKGTDPGMHT